MYADAERSSRLKSSPPSLSLALPSANVHLNITVPNLPGLGGLNLPSLPSLAGLSATISGLANLSLPSISLSLSLTSSGGGGGLIQALTNAVINAIEQAVVSALKSAGSSLLSSIEAPLKALQGDLDALKKNPTALTDALKAISGILGKAQAQQILAAQVFNSLNCAAQAEHLAEFWFNAN